MTKANTTTRPSEAGPASSPAIGVKNAKRKPGAAATAQAKTIPASKDTTTSQPAETRPVQKPRQTKAALLRTRLSAQGGASLAALMEATGWQAHTLRAALSGLRKQGLTLSRRRDGEDTFYAIDAGGSAEAVPAGDGMEMTAGEAGAAVAANGTEHAASTSLTAPSELADLHAMDRAGLARLWSDLLGGDVPAQMSQPMQRRFIAFEMQSRRESGLRAALRARLDRIAAGEERKPSPTLKPGARHLRQWNGTTHVVDVLPEGFLWNGRQHRSLSAIARAITGARWSGSRFFGLLNAADAGAGRSAKGKPRKTGVPRRTRAA